MLKKRLTSRPYFWGTLIALTLAIWLGVRVNSRPPDFVIALEREVPLATSPETVSRQLWDLSKWHEWIYAARAVESETRNWEVGRKIQIHFEPKRMKRKRFSWVLVITEYEPGKRIRLKLESDSNQKLTHLFESTEWEIISEPGKLIGRVRSKTQEPRARLWGRVAPKILMHQVLFADLEKLAGRGAAPGFAITPE